MKDRLQFFLALLVCLTISRPLCAAYDSIAIDVEDAAAPWSDAFGNGFANDIVRESFKVVNINVRFVIEPYSVCKTKVMSGAGIACLSMSASSSFRDKVRFSSHPIFSCSSEYYYNIRRPIKATSEDAIARGTVIGIVSSYEYPPSINELKKRGIRFISTASESASLNLLATGKVDLALINHNDIKPASVMISKLQLGKEVAFAFSSGILASHIGFSRAHPRGEWARKKFDEGHKLLIESGAAHNIEMKWAKSWARDLRP